MSRTIQTLSNYLGLSQPLNVNRARQRLQQLVDKYPDEMTLSIEADEITFGTDDVSFAIRADIDENLNTVYQGTITTYCPTVTTFTEYVSSPAKALAELRTLLKA
jgi:hypothetical protein